MNLGMNGGDGVLSRSVKSRDEGGMVLLGD